MREKELYQENKPKIRKKRSMLFRFLTTVIVAMLAVAIFIGGLSIWEVDKYVNEQAKEFVSVTCMNEGAKINDSLGNMEKSVKIMESYLMDFFESGANIEDSAFQDEVIASAEEMFRDVTKHTSNSAAVAYYFRLDPAISDGTSGLFYSKVSGKDEFLSFEPTDILAYDRTDTEHVGWFWQPYDAGEPVWMQPYHNQNNDILMISYVIPMYFGDRFIGVVGMDFDFVVLEEQVHGIEIYENGFAHLEMNGEIICMDKDEVAVDEDDYLRISYELVNGMTLTASASYRDILSARYDITLKILLTALLLFALFTVIAIFVVRRIVAPLKKLTDASVRLSAGDYGVEILHGNTREVDLLSTAFEDMAKRLYEREELLRRSANIDPLTGLQNTTAYTSYMAEFKKEIEAGTSDFGIAMLDLNNLKETNDEYGHRVGDELIRATANITAEVFAGSPIFRIGGDEFLVLLSGEALASREELFDNFKRICATAFVGDEGNIPVSVALGFAKFDPDRDAGFKDVFKRADENMYTDKRMVKAG